MNTGNFPVPAASGRCLPVAPALQIDTSLNEFNIQSMLVGSGRCRPLPSARPDACPHTIASAWFFLFVGVRRFRGGGHPVFHGTPTPTQSPVPLFSHWLGSAILWWLASRFPRDAYPYTMVSTCFFLVAGVWPFCGGGQSVFHGTPTPTE